jgi:post-segregation antitoxin (ccd killing protein)
MANLTITVDDDLLRRARARAVEQGNLRQRDPA